MGNEKAGWTICMECEGLGNKKLRLRKNSRIRYQKAFNQFEKIKSEGQDSVRPKVPKYACDNCNGSGLIPADSHPVADTENYPHVAIIGAGIGGVALAVAFLHRGIPFTLYERDNSFDARAQGYGFTLQQASKAIKGFGLFSLKKGVKSSLHVVHTTEGKVIVEWGMRMRMESAEKTSPKRINVHRVWSSWLSLPRRRENFRWLPAWNSPSGFASVGAARVKKAKRSGNNIHFNYS